jgi:NAD(P)-dependent dehydrogenase (short-subunit alcohol dehydrogenase family)
MNSSDLFSLEGKVAVITGGYGVLGGSIATGLASAGVRVAILGRRHDRAEQKVDELRKAGANARALIANVLDEKALDGARKELLANWGRIDILVNAAGGNIPAARNDNRPVFEVASDAFDAVMRLNLNGTVLPSMCFGEAMASERSGVIINISSMAALRAISGVLSYSVAKAGIDSFTRWLAVDLARRYGDGIRVNAIAPGYFVTEANRPTLFNDDGSLTPRAQAILAQTPMGRFGRPEEVTAAVQWLSSDAASFVTGVVIPIDGGFSAFSGV